MLYNCAPDGKTYDEYNSLSIKILVKLQKFKPLKIDLDWAQDIIEKAWERANRKYIPTWGTFKGYYIMTLNFCFKDWLRNRFKRNEHFDTINIDPLDLSNMCRYNSIVEKIETRAYIDTLMELLTYREKRIIMNYYIGGLTLEEIGKQIKVSESQACRIKNKALLKMRRKAEKECTKF